MYDFPMDDDVTLVYSCEGHEDISYTWEQDGEDLDHTHAATGVEHKLPGYGHIWQGGTLRVRASCQGSEYNAESEILVEGQGMYVTSSRVSLKQNDI